MIHGIVQNTVLLKAGALITINLPISTGNMIDTWLFAALSLGFLALCAVLRVIPGPARNDRLVAGTAAITMATAAALALSIAWGELVILDALVVIALLCFAGTFAIAQSTKGEGA